MDAIDAAGDAVTGALIGRAVEPRAGEHGGDAAHGMCLNCGTALIGEHCHRCGQSGHVHRSIAAIGHELAHGVFHFEGKIWRTLPLLLTRPGELTRRYVAGERARFVSPLAIFLFSVFLLFATISAVGGDISGDAVTLSPKAAAQIDKQIKEVDAKLAALSFERNRAKAAGTSLDDIEAQRTALRTTRQGLEMAVSGIGEAGTRSIGNFKTGWERLDKGIAKANANPSLTLYKLQTSAYKYSWALIPLSTPFVALLFLWRRRFAFYDHAIFVTYSLAFMMILVIALTLTEVAGVSAGWITLAALAIPPWHMFAQLRGAYSLRKRSAAWRTVALLMFAFTALLTFIVLLLLHGLT
jgi:hypothetical protein